MTTTKGVSPMSAECPVCIKAMRLFERFISKQGANFLHDGSVRFYFHPSGLRELLEAAGDWDEKVLEEIGVDEEFHVDYRLGSEGAVFRLQCDKELRPNEVVLRF